MHRSWQRGAYGWSSEANTNSNSTLRLRYKEACPFFEVDLLKAPISRLVDENNYKFFIGAEFGARVDTPPIPEVTPYLGVEQTFGQLLRWSGPPTILAVLQQVGAIPNFPPVCTC